MDLRAVDVLSPRLDKGLVALDAPPRASCATRRTLVEMDQFIPAGRRCYIDLGRLSVSHLRLTFSARSPGRLQVYPLAHPQAEGPIEFSSVHFGEAEYGNAQEYQSR